MMKGTLLISASVLVCSTVGGFSQFTAGNLAVLRAGNGTETLGNTGNSIFVDQFSTAGGYVNSVAIPNAGANALALSGTATSEGALVRSPNGSVLTFMGYNTVGGIPFASSLPATAGSVNPRGVGMLDASGSYSLIASSTTAFGGTSTSSGNPRSAVTDGINIWGVGSGNATSTRGVYSFGTTTFLTNGQSPRVISFAGANLAFSVSSTTAGSSGIFTLAGAPTTSGQLGSLFLSTGDGSSPYDFAFNSGLTTAYVADDRNNGLGGVQRYDWNGASWALTYTISLGATIGARGLEVDFSGANPVIYATTTETSANRLVAITDTGAGSAYTLLATAATGTVFRGVEFAPVVVPEPSVLALFGLGAMALLRLRRR